VAYNSIRLLQELIQVLQAEDPRLDRASIMLPQDFVEDGGQVHDVALGVYVGEWWAEIRVEADLCWLSHPPRWRIV